MRTSIGRAALVCGILLGAGNTSAQVDTEFWFAAPEISQDGSNFDRPIMLRITTLASAATVTVDQPANGGFAPIVVNIGANASASVDLTPFIGTIENTPANTVLNYGLRITSTADVSVYYENVSQQCLCNPEIFALKGMNGVGTAFIVPFQTYLNNGGGYTPTPYSSFDIVATENGTTVTITPTQALVGHPAGVPFTIALNQGQTWSGTAASQAAAQHPSGTSVTSDRPIAITIKDDLLSGAPYGGCADLMGDQIVPIENVGDEYIVMRGGLNGPDKAFVVGTQNGTSVTVAGAGAGTINAGQTLIVDISAPSTYITASAPVYLLHLSGFGCEVGGALLPPVICTGSTQLGFTRSTNEQFAMNLMTRTGYEGGFTINGNASLVPASAFLPVPNTNGDWMAAQIFFTTGQVAAGSGNVIANSLGKFHMGIIHGSGGGGTRYGYFSDFNSLDPPIVATAVDVCAGEDLLLTAASSPGATYSWTGPNGFTSTDQNPIIPAVTIADGGIYAVIAELDGCISDTASVTVTILDCPGDPILGIINDYTPVTGIDICTNAISVQNGSYFSVGDRALIIQMKGATIDLSNTAAYGNIADLGSAGLYEFIDVVEVNGNAVVAQDELLNIYDPAGLVQLITVPQYPDATAVGGTTALAWNGTIGGVLVFEVSGTLSLAADLDVSGTGFVGGSTSLELYVSCSSMDYVYDYGSGLSGRKGEGISPYVAAADAGRGKLANGGGGGNQVNAGGGGGGNAGAGGLGGDQWGGCPIIPIGGVGGLNLAYSNAAGRVFLGGGGGGGQQNDGNNYGSPGKAGGGIVIVRAGDILGNGYAIRANGLSQTFVAGSDGSGGGGAGGTVLLSTGAIMGNLEITAEGGAGGSTTAMQHGPGGGGGGGAIWTSAPLTGNITTGVAGGQAGTVPDLTTYGAQPGQAGTVLSGLALAESTTPWLALDTPQVQVGGPYCAGASFEIITIWESPTPVTFSWTGPNGFTSADQNPMVVNAQVAAGGVYTVTVTDANGCTNSESVTVVVNANPVANAGTDDAICLGESHQLNGSGGVTYEWSPAGSLSDPTIANPTAAPLVTTDYILVVTNTNGCSGSDTVTITVNPLPTVNAGADESICINSTVQLTASGAVSYQWSPATGLDDAAIADPVFSELSTQSYTVTGTDANGCQDSDDLTVTVIVLPPVSAGNDTSICTGDALQLVATGAVGYVWDPITDLSNATIGNPVFNGTQTSTFTVTGTDASGCVATDDITIIVNPLPVVDAGNDVAICAGQTTDLQATGAQTYLWSPSANLDDASLSALTFSGMSTAVLTATGTDANGCIASDQVTVTVHPLPVAIIDPIADVCLGSATMFTQSSTGGIINYDWTLALGVAATGVTALHTYNAPSDYPVELLVTDTNGCQHADTSTATVLPLPQPVMNIANGMDVCENEPIQFTDLTPGTVVAYAWNFNYMPGLPSQPQFSSSQPTPMFTYLQYGTYTVRLSVLSDLGCVNAVTRTVNVHDVPVADFMSNTVCEGAVTLLNSLSTVQDASQVNGWQWALADGSPVGYGEELTHTYDTAGTYPVELIVQTNEGCRDTVVRNVQVNPTPVIAFSGNDVCLGELTVFQNNSSPQDSNIVSWDWTFGDGQVGQGDSATHTYTVFGTYPVTLTALTDSGCSATGDISVRSFPFPVVALTALVPEGCEPLTVPFANGSSIPLGFIASYTWDMGDGQTYEGSTASHVYQDTIGTFDVTLTAISDQGCTTIATEVDAVTVNVTPEADFSQNETVLSMLDPLLVLTDLSQDALLYTWTFGDGSSSAVASPAHRYTEHGEYDIVLTVRNGECIDTKASKVIVEPLYTFHIPNTFTPNNNGHNDTFRGEGEGWDTYTLSIYDRWGELIFYSAEQTLGWDGSYKGTPAQQGYYIYHFRVMDWTGETHSYIGKVLLMR